MNTVQLISFVLLWVVLVTEGVLLFFVYRHVGLLYAPKSKGLPAGAHAPHF